MNVMLRRGSSWAWSGIVLWVFVLSGCLGYGGETSGVDNAGVVRSDGEFCELTLPDGWTWYPAQWAAESPAGTGMAFEDTRYGRPANADWDEVVEAKLASVRDRTPDAQIEQTDTIVTVDYGDDAGFSYLRRFDTIGCQITFSNAKDTRATEFTLWQGIIDSLRRISPDPEFTPPSE